MITVKTLRKPSLKVLEHKNYPDYKRVTELYDKWDAAAKNKDFHAAEHFDWEIQKIHKRNGISET
jgi:hypothetical protein